MPPLATNPTFPALYRQHVYFLSSAEARTQFMANPLAFLCQPSPMLVVPIRIAIVGPPKSGKTTCMICSLSYFTLLLLGHPWPVVGVSHLKESRRLRFRALSVSSGLLCNSVAVYLTSLQFILQLKLFLHYCAPFIRRI